jgi:hypothetical protein
MSSEIGRPGGIEKRDSFSPVNPVFVKRVLRVQDRAGTT